MSGKKRTSQKIKFNARKNTKISDYFSQVPKEEQNDSSFSQVKVKSRKRPSDITNTGGQRSLSPKKIRQDRTPPPNKTIRVTLDVNIRKNKNMKYELTHSETSTVYAALSTLSAVKEEIESHQGREMLVCGKEGIDGYINLGMPLCCFPEGSHLVITFSQDKKEHEDKQLFEPQLKLSTDYVQFHIHAVGNKMKRILKCGELHKKGNKLCVYGFKGETIRDTLRKDGRFCSFVETDRWKLINNLDTIIENTQPVDELEGKLFQVEVERRENPKATSVTQNSESEKIKFCELEEYIVNQYPRLKEEREKFRAYIKKIEKRKKASLFKVHKENFGKQTKNSTTVHVHKRLSQLSDSVGYLWWNNNGNAGCATCFVFTGLYIFTCRHVINDIVGEGIELGMWASIISRCVKVTFEYEQFLRPGCVFDVEPWFEISDVNLDYAVLQLKENGRRVPAALYNKEQERPVPHSGLVYIIGHPDGNVKSIDACAVVPLGNQERHKENSQAMEEAGSPFSGSFVHMFTQRSFVYKPNALYYNTSFFGGSSGSPVLDSNGSLVAMHAAGATFQYRNETINIIEYGSTMASILDHIKENYKSWYDINFEIQQDVEMLSPEY